MRRALNWTALLVNLILFNLCLVNHQHYWTFWLGFSTFSIVSNGYILYRGAPR